MRLVLKCSVFVLFFALLIGAGQVLGKNRYKEACFDSVSTRMDLYYRTAPDCFSNPDSLFMDIYEPQNDTASLRPVIVMLYGGAYITGSRKDDLITTYSNYFASCGYAVFAIDYRIGINETVPAPLNQLEVPKAMYRAIQDSRAAIRFIRKNAELYKIDTTRIFAMGYSAGAITLIHHAYVDQAEAAQNQLLVMAFQILGALDEGEDLQHSSGIHCVINCCGAIADTSWIKSGETPILSFHGTVDQVVPYGTGYIYNDASTVIMHGSSVIDQKAKSAGLTSQLVSFEGADHYLEGEPRVLIPITTANFLYGLMNSSEVKFRAPLISKMQAHRKKAHVQHFDISGRIIKKQSVLAPALIVRKMDSHAQPMLLISTGKREEK